LTTPVYESSEHIAREERARVALVKKMTSYDFIKTPPLHLYDWDVYKNGVVVQLAEFRGRSDATIETGFIQRDGVIFSKTKGDALYAISEERDMPVWVFFGLTNAIYGVEVCEIVKCKDGYFNKRKIKRPDAYSDEEYVYHIPVEKLRNTEIKDWQY
jgi:hypothetical protein